MKHLNITVKGVVQGVFFRASTKDQADQLGICGLVRNEQDGSVYVEAEGEDFQLDIFLSWLSEGPPAARVESVETAHAVLQNHSGFEITG